jgi:hypothetical protein
VYVEAEYSAQLGDVQQLRCPIPEEVGRQHDSAVAKPLESSAQKKGPDTVASRGQVPRSSPRLPPVVAEGGMRGAFLSAETAEYLDSRSRNLT